MVHASFGFVVRKLERFEYFSLVLGMLSANGIAAESAQATHFKKD
jgi:hypothetical protein